MGNFELRFHHLLVIGILAISFSLSFLIRSQPLEYGYELNEFDPFFNLRATQFLVDNGVDAYNSWHDDMTWYPVGRDISGTSQVMQHVTAAALYQVFGGGSSLYDFVIMFPVIFGSLTAIVVFALVRVLGGTTAGLFASLFFALSLPIIIRGMAGWFKSEPLGLFYGLLAVYLFLSGIKSDNKKIAFLKLVGGGILLSFGLSAWGGIQFFIIPLGIFFLALPLIRKDFDFLLWAIPTFVAAFALSLLLFERPGIRFLFGIGGFALIGPTAYLVVSIFIQKFSREEVRLRNAFVFLVGMFTAGMSVLALNSINQFLPLASFRYMNALNPFLTTVDPLVDSVAEHASTPTDQSFFFLSILMIFAGIGIWLLFANRERLQRHLLPLSNDMIVFSLIIAIMGAYTSSSFVRLELFASISVIILSSLGLAILASEILKPQENYKKKAKPIPLFGKISFVVVVTALLLVPTVLPTQGNWIDSVRVPPTILNGGTNYNIVSSEWFDATEWLKNNTSEDAKIVSWWDYGYWITTLAERVTFVDNATMSTMLVQNIARLFLASPDEAWATLNEMEADYILVFIAATKIQADPFEVYFLTGGADESKKQWFMRIAAEEPLEKYLYSDGFSGTPHFWGNTILGNMIPYTPAAYIDPNTGDQSEVYRPGYTAIYLQDLKYPADGDGPLKLAYSSESFDKEEIGPITAIMIYEVNKDYQPASMVPELIVSP